MFNQTQRPSDPKASVFNSTTATLGSALGVAMAILFTPPLYGVFRIPLVAYLIENYGVSLARWCAYAMAAVIAIVIYVAVKLVIVLSVTWCAAALAARRFPGT